MNQSPLERTVTSSRPGRTRRVLELLAVSAVALGGAYLTSLAAGRLGLPTSRELIFEGQWQVSGWDRFPWLDAAGMVVFMALLPLAWRRFRLRGTPSPGPHSNRRVLLFAGIGVISAVLVYAARLVGGRLSDALSPGSLMILVVYWFVVALGEEATFRGALQAGCESLAGIYVALGVATAAFVLWHGWPVSIGQLLVRTAAGIGFGLLYHGSRSLVPSVLCHWLLNVALVA